MGLVIGTIWLFNLIIVLGGYIALLVCISMCIFHQTSKTQFFRLSVFTCALSLPVAWVFLHGLLNSIPEKRLYTLTAFTEITWRPLMIWLAVIAVGCYAAGHVFRKNRPTYFLFSGFSAVSTYAGLVQAIAGLFFANDIFRAYGFELFY